MIDREKSPVGWATLMYEPDDAHEHLGNPLTEMNPNGNIDETEFRIQSGHAYAHLNRAWFCRNAHEDFPESEREVASGFPTDLDPIG